MFWVFSLFRGRRYFDCRKLAWRWKIVRPHGEISHNADGNWEFVLSFFFCLFVLWIPFWFKFTSFIMKIRSWTWVPGSCSPASFSSASFGGSGTRFWPVCPSGGRFYWSLGGALGSGTCWKETPSPVLMSGVWCMDNASSCRFLPSASSPHSHA